MKKILLSSTLLVLLFSCGRSTTDKYSYYEIQWTWVDSDESSIMGCYYSPENEPFSFYFRYIDGEEQYGEFVGQTKDILTLFHPLSENGPMDFDEYFSEDREFNMAFEQGSLFLIHPDMTAERFSDDGSLVSQGVITLVHLTKSELPEDISAIVKTRNPQKIPVKDWPNDLLRAIDRDLNYLYSDGDFKVIEWNYFREIVETSDGTSYFYSLVVDYKGIETLVQSEVTVK